MAKIGVLKPFRGAYDNIKNIVLENGEIAFDTTNKAIFMGDGSSSIANLLPFISNQGAIEYSITDQYIVGFRDNIFYTLPDTLNSDAASSSLAHFASYQTYPVRILGQQGYGSYVDIIYWKQNLSGGITGGAMMFSYNPAIAFRLLTIDSHGNIVFGLKNK